MVKQSLVAWYKRISGQRQIDLARQYVRTDTVSGRLQFELLIREGLRPNSKLLEIGCGCLNAGEFIIGYLEKGNYVGIDPNEWLRSAALRSWEFRHFIIKQKSPIFLSNQNFDASALDTKFDFAFSHSVLSHCAHWQLEQYLRNVRRVLKPNGVILASIRLAEGNAYGSPGNFTRDDSGDAAWVYPGVSWFKMSTVEKIAAEIGLVARYRPEYTEFYTKTRPDEVHDWIAFSPHP